MIVAQIAHWIIFALGVKAIFIGSEFNFIKFFKGENQIEQDSGN